MVDILLTKIIFVGCLCIHRKARYATLCYTNLFSIDTQTAAYNVSNVCICLKVTYMSNAFLVMISLAFNSANSEKVIANQNTNVKIMIKN
jgi:hypothetical protein